MTKQVTATKTEFTIADFISKKCNLEDLSPLDQSLVSALLDTGKQEAEAEAKAKAEAEAKAKAEAEAEAKAKAEEAIASMAFFTKRGLLSSSIRQACQSALNSIIPALPVMRYVNGVSVPGVQGLCLYTPTENQLGRRSVLSYQLNQSCFIRLTLDIESGQLSYAKRGRKAKTDSK